ncbi:MAG: hypothetical protein ACYCZJ_10055 [Sulfuriferula sp.]
MSRHYSPKNFFRNASNAFLKRYFTEHGVLLDMDFDALSETKVTPIYAAWLKLPEEVRNEMERDFQDIDALSCESGTQSILDEAAWHGENLAEMFATLESFHAKAFWTFLDRPTYWQGASAFHHADSVPASYWRKRKNLIRAAAKVDDASLRQLENNLSHYFHNKQGRGQNCKVDCYKRGELDYFFAYPEDYAHSSIEWEGKEFRRRSHHPAFEIIFVYSQHEGTLNVFLAGTKKLVPELQSFFVDTILGLELGEHLKDERVYDLALLKQGDMQFNYPPESGITQVAVKKLRLKILGTNERITLEANPTHNGRAVYDLLDKLKTIFTLSQIVITQVGLVVTFAHVPPQVKPATRSFDVCWPNSCSLGNDGRDAVIRKMLADSGIEPREQINP